MKVWRCNCGRAYDMYDNYTRHQVRCPLNKRRVSPTAIVKVLKFCEEALSFYRKNPPIIDYQLGYEAAIEQVMEFATNAKDEEDDQAREGFS